MTTAYAPIPPGAPHDDSRRTSDRSRSSNSTQIVENHFSEADAVSQRSTPDMGNRIGAKSAHGGSSERSLEVSGGDVFDEPHSAQAGHVFDHTIEAPIVGHEVMEQRARFTVFKINVRKGPLDTWFIFRRYTDFVRLNDKLRVLFPGFRLSLPPKRWFGDNFDLSFLEDRIIGLQAFMSNILGHRDVSISQPVIEFFCLDDPPGPHDSLEDSRALCESLEETVYNLGKDLQERDARIELLQEELSLLKTETEGIRKVLNSRRSSPGSMHSTGSVLDCDLNSYTEADSAHMSQNLGQNETLTEYVSEQDVLLRSAESGSVLAVNSAQNSHETLKLFARKARAIEPAFKT